MLQFQYLIIYRLTRISHYFYIFIVEMTLILNHVYFICIGDFSRTNSEFDIIKDRRADLAHALEVCNLCMTDRTVMV